ncbi:penicillin-binding transpeptidase domain-containing protein [Jiulongibacter sp. NS-SX5]|uniref:penicillin-binding transpeptidase domain-containing protein n=1 Tax=Jiulongibacter sp. NS-SX5 TaxID=3463854 RepID=UPI004057FA6D
MSSIKSQIQSHSLRVFIGISLFGVIILYGIIRIQSNEELVNKAVEKSLIFEEEIPAMRGNIYGADGKSLLATSVPYYYMGLDTDQARDDLFDHSIDSLSYLLSRFFKDKSKQEYKSLISKRRKDPKRRYLRVVSRRISHQEKEVLQTFPLFREGKFKGGGIFEPVPTRSLPFNSMAMRTIGSLDRDTKTKGLFGIEYSYNAYLAGKNGKALVKRLAGGVKLPLESDINTEAKPGMDVVTTIDVNFQDIVESALRKKVEQTNASYGSAIVMETATGEIKAITNLTKRVRNGETFYLEDMNHAVLGSTDPGSTFKLASIMAVLEEKGIGLDDYAANCTGKIMHHGLPFTCDHVHGDITVRQVFEKSCNIGIYKLIERTFGMKGIDQYVEYVNQFNLDKPIGFQLKGEKKPYFKNSEDKTYSRSTLPWMSIGYESSISPLQMMAFYNAVANDGYWVEPYLVKEIREGNQVIEQYVPRKSSQRIASSNTIEAAQEMMRGVVDHGTGAGIKDGFCKVAGKTGTAQKLSKQGYSKQGKYYTSFMGFFPANQPKYTCVVVIDNPQGTGMYASKVCAPVFREIADKIFAYDVKIHPAQQKQYERRLLALQQKAGISTDLQEIAEELDLPTEPNSDGILKAAIVKNDSLIWKKLNEDDGMPNVRGMTLRDALPLLENKGYTVRHRGLGKVKDYALSGSTVSLVLN